MSCTNTRKREPFFRPGEPSTISELIDAHNETNAADRAEDQIKQWASVDEHCGESFLSALIGLACLGFAAAMIAWHLMMGAVQ